MDDNKFSRRLRELREAKAQKLGRRRIPQREVAAELNITPGAYGSWESGRTRPGIEMLPQIAGYFEVSIDFLLGHTAGVQASPERITTETGLTLSLKICGRWFNGECQWL